MYQVTSLPFFLPSLSPSLLPSLPSYLPSPSPAPVLSLHSQLYIKKFSAIKCRRIYFLRFKTTHFIQAFALASNSIMCYMRSCAYLQKTPESAKGDVKSLAPEAKTDADKSRPKPNTEGTQFGQQLTRSGKWGEKMHPEGVQF